MGMERFTNAIRGSIETKNWLGALTLALTMPDICGRLEAPNQSSSKRYAAWWDRYMAKHYSFFGRPTMLAGGDAYALRCSYLHEGGSDITLQRAKVALDNFHFVAPMEGWKVHGNRINNILQLQVDVFAQQICDAATEWAQDTSGDPEIEERKTALIVIHQSMAGIPGILTGA